MERQEDQDVDPGERQAQPGGQEHQDHRHAELHRRREREHRGQRARRGDEAADRRGAGRDRRRGPPEAHPPEKRAGRRRSAPARRQRQRQQEEPEEADHGERQGRLAAGEVAGGERRERHQEGRQDPAVALEHDQPRRRQPPRGLLADAGDAVEVAAQVAREDQVQSAGAEDQPYQARPPDRDADEAQEEPPAPGVEEDAGGEDPERGEQEPRVDPGELRPHAAEIDPPRKERQDAGSGQRLPCGRRAAPGRRGEAHAAPASPARRQTNSRDQERRRTAGWSSQQRTRRSDSIASPAAARSRRISTSASGRS